MDVYHSSSSPLSPEPPISLFCHAAEFVSRDEKEAAGIIVGAHKSLGDIGLPRFARASFGSFGLPGDPRPNFEGLPPLLSVTP
jgi:hypothetical protein